MHPYRNPYAISIQPNKTIQHVSKSPFWQTIQPAPKAAWTHATGSDPDLVAHSHLPDVSEGGEGNEHGSWMVMASPLEIMKGDLSHKLFSF